MNLDLERLRLSIDQSHSELSDSVQLRSTLVLCKVCNDSCMTPVQRKQQLCANSKCKNRARRDASSISPGSAPSGAKRRVPTNGTALTSLVKITATAVNNMLNDCDKVMSAFAIAEPLMVKMERLWTAHLEAQAAREYIAKVIDLAASFREAGLPLPAELEETAAALELEVGGADTEHQVAAAVAAADVRLSPAARCTPSAPAPQVEDLAGEQYDCNYDYVDDPMEEDEDDLPLNIDEDD